MKVRIGIDVGGTFTDAVAIDDATYEILGTVKIPTTHAEKGGVAVGIIKALHKVMEDNGIRPEDVSFIAHGTTQSTNALLEGDVVDVGVITLGSGLQGLKSKSDTSIPPIDLAPGKQLNSRSVYIDTAEEGWEQSAAQAIEELHQQGVQSIVAAEAFSVDNPEHENRALELCSEMGIPATATNDVSKLYGLKIRTRTAVINASIMPRMLETALMTEQSIQEAKIQSPLMIMRCDGGVMTMQEVRRRPILTILSGPSAGVAGALMYEKLTDGFFFEVGGTSTDISCVRDGKVMIRYAEVGGHKTYLNSLDIHTVGIGGGSMIALDANGQISDVGPRSAHIAAMEYEAYASVQTLTNPQLFTVRPRQGDWDYACIDCGEKRYALTLSGAAIIAGYVRPEDYAYASPEAARLAWEPLAKKMGCSVEQAAGKALKLAAKKVMAAVNEMAQSYKIDLKQSRFVGGGGGSAVVVPFVAQTAGVPHKIAENAPIISTIGVALAMIRESVERTVSDPTEQDISAIRKEAIAKVIDNGASLSTVEVTIEVDPQKNLLRAVAVGAMEMRKKSLGHKLSQAEILAVAAESMGVEPDAATIQQTNGFMNVVVARKEEKRLFGLVKRKVTHLRVVDDEGVIRLKKENAQVVSMTASQVRGKLKELVSRMTQYNDAGVSIPGVYIIAGRKLLDFTGVMDENQLLSLAQIECSDFSAEEPVIAVAVMRGKL